MQSTLEDLSEEESYLYKRFLNNMYPTIKDEEIESVKELCFDHLLITLKNRARFIWCVIGNEILTVDHYNSGFFNNTQILKEFKHLIKFWMVLRNIDQTKLSEITGYSATSISRYVNGERTPDIYILRRLADALDITVDKFYFYY